MITLSCKVIKSISAAVSLLPQELWPLNLAKWWLTIRNLNPWSHTTLWTRDHVGSRDKLKTFYIHYHNTYGHQTWQGGCAQWGVSIHKVIMTLWSRGLVILISYILFVCLECKRLSHHRLFVSLYFGFGKVSNISPSNLKLKESLACFTISLTALSVEFQIYRKTLMPECADNLQCWWNYDNYILM